MATGIADDPVQPRGISGRSHDGRALAHHRAPSPDLAPWIARLFVTAADQPADNTLACGLFNDTAFVRLIVRGAWEGDSAAGTIRRSQGPLLFGPHTHRMPIRVTGPFATFGFALRPGALSALEYPWGETGNNLISEIACEPEWHDLAKSADLDAHGPDHWLDLLEDGLRRRFAAISPRPPSELAEALDMASFTDPGEPIADIAARVGVGTKRLGRMALRDFGISPKQVMRRARVLDMASQLLGFADRAEAEEHAMRFYDQSHQIRDFRALMGMTPRQVARSPQPILTLGLEARQARRLEAIGRFESGQPLPWR